VSVEPDAMIRQIVGRCHVGQSYLSVVRYVCSRLRHGRQTFLNASKDQRRLLIAMTIEQHKRNRAEYGDVMGGGWGYSGR